MMKASNALRAAAAAVMLASAVPALPIAAQQPVELGAPVSPRNMVRVPCCRCLDGSRETVQISTGTAPWQVALPNSNNFAPVVPASNSAWAPVPPGQWVGPAGAPTTIGDYRFQLRIHVPRCVIPGRIEITGKFAGDNKVKVLFNGNQIAASVGTPDYGFLPGSITGFSVAVNTPGMHTLTFVVTNSGGPTGLVVGAQINRICPKELEHTTQAGEGKG